MCPHHPSNALTSYIPWTHTHPPWNSGKRNWDTMKLASKLGRASSERAKDTKLDSKRLWLHTSSPKCFSNCRELHQHSLQMEWRGNPQLYPRRCFSPPPLLSVSPYHFPRLFTANTRATLPELFMDSQAAIYCQVLPHCMGLTLLSWQPSIQEHGAEEVGGWLCAGSGCDVLREGRGWGVGVAWCHPVAWRGPIKPWENYVTFCWAGPFRAIEVQWIESCREVIFPLSCVCVYVCENSEERGGATSREVHCRHANVVDRKQGHKDVMKLSLETISTGDITPPFFSPQMALTSSLTNLILNMSSMMLWITCQDFVKHWNKSLNTQQWRLARSALFYCREKDNNKQPLEE